MLEALSCNAPYNEGGLGKTLALLVEASRERGELGRYYASRSRPGDSYGREISLERFRWLFKVPPLRYSFGWRDFAGIDLFDRAVAAKLERLDRFHGFTGRAQHSFARARKLGYERLVLECPSSHVLHVMRQHRRATRAFPVEKSWLNGAQSRKTLREYETADLLYVNSEYSRQTYLEAGVPETKLRRRILTVEPRFAPAGHHVDTGSFTIVYVGRLQGSKGVPVLLEAFRNLHEKNAELILVGGYATDDMEKYVAKRAAADPRIKVVAGDPLAYLHRADVLVHPSFEDGLGLAPLEAMACGVPVIVTEDTGMKEYVVNDVNGYILPTGDVDALVDQLRAIRSRPLKGTFDCDCCFAFQPRLSVVASR